MKNLKVNKAHDWGNVSIRMIKACSKSLILPLKLTFKGVVIINPRYRGGRDLPGVSKPLFTYYRAIKAFFSFLPG